MKSQNVFFLDVDGVVLSFNGGLDIMISDEYRDFYDRSFSVDEMLNMIREFEEPESFVKRFMHSEYFTRLPMITKKSCVQKLKKLGSLYFLTNIQPTALKLREENFNLFGIDYDDLMVGGTETYGLDNYPLKSDVIKTYQEKMPDAVFHFVDDLPVNCYDVKNNCEDVRVFLIRESHLGVYDGAEDFHIIDNLCDIHDYL